MMMKGRKKQTMKKTISILLMLVMLFSLSTAALAEANNTQTVPAADAQTVFPTPVKATDEAVSTQIQYLFNNFNTFKQPESDGTKWSYAVTDLNHNGRLELLAASVQGSGRYTYVCAWEVGADMNSAAPIQVNVPEEESFPDIVTDSADTFYNPANNMWIYMFYDNIVLSADETYYAKCAVKLADDGLSFQQLALQHNQAAGGIVNTAYMDNSGDPITGEQYNAAGTEGPAQLIKSSTNFEWVDAANVVSQNALFNSYSVFKGMMQPTSKPAQQPAPAAPANTQTGGFLTVTKNPTNESRGAGGTAYFVANASTWTSLSWTFVSPQGGEYNADGFGRMFPNAKISGANGTTLTVANVSANMNGWGVYCTFYSGSQTARTGTAFLYVSGSTTTTTSTSGTYSYYYDLDYYIIYNRDGPYTMYFSDGSSLTVYKDSTYVYTEKNGTSTRYTTPGAWVVPGVDTYDPWIENDDGTWSYVSRNGNVTTFYDYGSSEIFNGVDTRSYDQFGNEVFRRTRNDDGSEETYDPESNTYTYTDEDGYMFTRYSDGSFSVTENDGTVVNYDRYGDVEDTWYEYDTVPEVFENNQWGWAIPPADDYENPWLENDDGTWSYISRNGNVTTFSDDGSYDVYDGESFYSYDADDTFTGSWPSNDYDDYFDFSYEESYVEDYAGLDEDAWW